MTQCSLSILLLVLGLVITVVGYKYFARLREVAKWISVPAAVTEKAVGCFSRPEVYAYVKYYYPVVLYRYEVDDCTFESTRYSIDREGWWSTDKKSIETLLDSGDSLVSVYVDPQDPRSSVMQRNVSPRRLSHYWGTLFGGVIVTAMAALSAMFMCF